MIVQIITLILLALMNGTALKNDVPYFENDSLIRNDLEIVWPLVQTVKIEYDLANAQLAFLETKAEKDQFLKEFEEFIKKKYFKEVFKLNFEQGKLLILLIHKEIGKTAYELLKEYRNISRANFWNRMASMFGASLKEEYTSEQYPTLEMVVQEKQPTFILLSSP